MLVAFVIIVFYFPILLLFFLRSLFNKAKKIPQVCRISIKVLVVNNIVVIAAMLISILFDVSILEVISFPFYLAIGSLPFFAIAFLVAAIKAIFSKEE